MQRRDCSVQHVIDAVVGAGLFDGGDVGWFLDHTHQPQVARGTGTIGAGINISDVVADRAEMEFFFEIVNGRGECVRILSAGAKNMERQPLCAFTPHAGKLFQFIDESSHRLGEFGHEKTSSQYLVFSSQQSLRFELASNPLPFSLRNVLFDILGKSAGVRGPYPYNAVLGAFRPETEWKPVGSLSARFRNYLKFETVSLSGHRDKIKTATPNSSHSRNTQTSKHSAHCRLHGCV